MPRKPRTDLSRLIDEAAETGEPLLIMGPRNHAVLILEALWTAIQETLHLLSVPGMRESPIEGRQTPVSECSEDIDS
jgi:antitoxin YefM